MTWAEAQSLAESYNGYLVCVNDEPELDWLNDPTRMGGSVSQCWLGAWQDAGAPEPGEGWHWVDGRPFDWPTSPPGIGPWAEGEPDDPIGDQDVAHWEPGTEEGCGWYDDNENSPMDWIAIERETVHDDQHLPIYPNEDGNAVWCDYLDDQIYREYVVDDPGANPPTVSNGRSYLTPYAHLDPGFDPVYYHHDHLGTTRLLSQETVQGHDLFAHLYSAFGQSILEPDPPMTRYGYVGAYGYEGGLLTFEGAQGTIPMTLSHVGERWYDPSIGRFIQRDPIGIAGGSNVYAYAGSDPANRVDPAGAQWYEPEVTNPNWPAPRDCHAFSNPIEKGDKIQEETAKKTIDEGHSDTWAHCVAMCRLVSEIHGGFALGLPIGIIKEIGDLLGGAGVMDTCEDIIGNCLGFCLGPGAAVSDDKCEDLCSKWIK